VTARQVSAPNALGRRTGGEFDLRSGLVAGGAHRQPAPPAGSTRGGQPRHRDGNRARRGPSGGLSWYLRRPPRSSRERRRGRAPASHRGQTRRTASAFRPDSGRTSAQSTCGWRRSHERDRTGPHRVWLVSGSRLGPHRPAVARRPGRSSRSTRRPRIPSVPASRPVPPHTCTIPCRPQPRSSTARRNSFVRGCSGSLNSRAGGASSMTRPPSNIITRCEKSRANPIS
jgi:hypothetical protein